MNRLTNKIHHQIYKIMDEKNIETLYLYDYEVLLRNLAVIKLQFDSKFFSYDLSLNPNLTITKIIYEAIKCKIFIPHESYADYLALIEIPKTDILFLPQEGIQTMAAGDLFKNVTSVWFKVRYMKTVKGKDYVILSGGTNVLWEAMQNRNAYRPRYKISVYSHHFSLTEKKMTLCGPLCTPQDTIVFDHSMSAISENDIICIENIESHTFYKSPFYFISHDFPHEYIKDGDKFSSLTRSKKYFLESSLNCE